MAFHSKLYRIRDHPERKTIQFGPSQLFHSFAKLWCRHFCFNCIRNLQKLINRVEIKSTLGLKCIVDEWRCWCYEKCKKCPAGMSQFLALTSASSFVFIETMRNLETPNEISDEILLISSFPVYRNLLHLSTETGNDD
ncbi:unnamed protein product, partial [Mesorhabditis belari]|uniref:Uncharacterized protein n=1 Tax=Mesorhabditis belari TaxID=2138241 RepID=A0AAF3F8N6_9BILA